MPGNQQSAESTRPIQLDLWGEKQENTWKEFRVAREYARSLKIKDVSEWKAFIKKRYFQGTGIPEDPERVYKHQGWNGWDDWLGCGGESPFPRDQSTDNSLKNNLWSIGSKSKWLNFFEARQIVRGYGFEYREEWELFVKGKFPDRKPFPENIPPNPDLVYRFVGWKDWKDWLVHPDQRMAYTPFPEARDFVRSNRIPDKTAYRDFLKQNPGLIREYQMCLPVRPELEYLNSGWINWEDWLGIGIGYQDFNTTRKFIRSLRLSNKQEWTAFIRGQLFHKPNRSANIFAHPEIAYKNDGWSGWDDWLGTGNSRGAGSIPRGIPEGTKECMCKGTLINCPYCEGKGYYYP